MQNTMVLTGIFSAIRFCERFMEFVIDLLSQLPTRRFVRAVLDDQQVLVKARCRRCSHNLKGAYIDDL